MRQEGAEVQGDGLKKCIRCGEFKERAQFHRNRRTPDGIHYYCKACLKAYRDARYLPKTDAIRRREVEANARWRAAHRDQDRRAARARERRRREALEALLGSQCADCGTSDGPFDFDHIDPFSKSFTIGGKDRHRSMEQLVQEVRKCQLLCKPCHNRKTSAELRKNRELRRILRGLRDFMETAGVA